MSSVQSVQNLTHEDNSLQALKSRVIQDALARCKSDKTLCEQFLTAYYRNLNTDDVLLTNAETSQAHQNIIDDLAGMALHHFDLLKSYNRQSPNIAVFNPNVETHQFHSSHSVIQMVAIDRPFLVDTVLMSLEKQGVNVHRLFHTIIKVDWQDEQGNGIDAIRTADDSDSRYVSLIHCEIDRQLEADLTDIQDLLMQKVQVLDTVTGDWEAMRAKLSAIKDEMANADLSELDTLYDADEVKAFLEWILDDNFIFLGYREYRLQFEDGEKDVGESVPDLMTVGGSGLGLLGGVNEDARSESFYGLPNRLKQLLTRPQGLLLSKSSHE